MGQYMSTLYIKFGNKKSVILVIGCFVGLITFIGFYCYRYRITKKPSKWIPKRIKIKSNKRIKRKRIKNRNIINNDCNVILGSFCERGFTRNHGIDRGFIANGYNNNHYKSLYWTYKYQHKKDFFVHKLLYKAIKKSELIVECNIPDDLIKEIAIFSFGRIMVCDTCDAFVDIMNTSNITLMIEELKIKGGFHYFVCDDKILCDECININNNYIKYHCNYCNRLSCCIKGYKSQCSICKQFCCDRDQNKIPPKYICIYYLLTIYMYTKYINTCTLI